MRYTRHSVVRDDVMAITDDIIARANDDLRKAVSRAEDARKSLSKAEAEVTEIQAFLKTFERYAPMLVGGGEQEHRRNVNSSLAAPGSRGRELVDASIEAINAAGRPLKIGALLDAVLAAGHTLGGADQKSNLAGYLSRDPRIHSLGRSVGWDLIRHEAGRPASDDALPLANPDQDNSAAILPEEDKYNF